MVLERFRKVPDDAECCAEVLSGLQTLLGTAVCGLDTVPGVRSYPEGMSDQSESMTPVTITAHPQTHTNSDVTSPDCPWGDVLAAEVVEPGVVFVKAADHSGYSLSPQAQTRLPERHRRTWYEQDCEAAFVAYYLGWEMQGSAKVVLDAVFPDWDAP